MNNIAKALAWAFAIIGVAVAGQVGWIDHDMAQTLTLALPVLAYFTLGQSRSCASLPPQTGRA